MSLRKSDLSLIGLLFLSHRSYKDSAARKKRDVLSQAFFGNTDALCGCAARPFASEGLLGTADEDLVAALRRQRRLPQCSPLAGVSREATGKTCGLSWLLLLPISPQSGRLHLCASRASSGHFAHRLSAAAFELVLIFPFRCSEIKASFTQSEIL